MALGRLRGPALSIVVKANRSLQPVPAGTLGSEAERKVDVNHASAAELEGLPGIGPATAARIVRSRDARPFVRIDELQTRGLVTPRVFADIREQLTTR
ncbi:MAG: helix-hairpin-helix domain-containing protein [Chloroflexi bacterium]|nr:MAG: helix-hairpin-helix domain-containing protein [Chloroflexota bacterium]